MSLRTIFLVALVLVLLAAPTLAKPERDVDLGQVLEDLERGIRALKALDRHEAARELAELAAGVRERLEHMRGKGDRTERQIVAHRLEIMRVAMHAFREAEKREAMELMEHCIHAGELALEGRRDEEAVHIMKTAPKRGARIELLMLAADLWKGFGNEKKAALCDGLARELRGQEERKDRPHAKKERGERQMVEEWIEVMRHAMKALLEAGKKDLAETIERKIHSFELQLEGRKDEEARHIVESAPSLGQCAEILAYAADLWAEFGDRRAAAFTSRVAKEMAGHARKAEKKRDRAGGSDVAQRLEKLEANLREVMKAVDRIAREIRELEERIR